MESMTLVLSPENNSFQGKRVVVVNQPITIGRATDNNDAQAPNSLKFNSKVVSRAHARISFSDNKFYIQDTKSSSGTFLNGERLSPQATESRVVELHDGDVIKLGEDFNQQGVVHMSIVMRVRLPGVRHNEADETEDDAYVDLTMDNEVRANVDDEFNTIWNSLVADINSPLKRLRNASLLTSANSATSLGSSSPVNTSSLSKSISQASPTTTQTFCIPPVARNDNTVTLITDPNAVAAAAGAISNTAVSPDVQASSGTTKAADVASSQECVTLIESLQWETVELKETLVELARKQDTQLIAFYRSLKGFPSSFINVASKYAKYSKTKK